VIPRLVLLLILLAGVAFYRWRRLERAVNLLAMTFWAVLISNLLLLPQYIAARQPAEWCDAQLARADALLGVQVPDVLRLMDHVPAFSRALEVAYGTLIFLMTLAIMVPPLCGRMYKAKEFAIASVVAAAISLPLFAVFQARGPWDYYGYAPSPPQAASAEALRALKSPEWFVVSLSDLNGLICFPSFHTILALLSANALWSIPYLRWPSAALALLIVLATVTTGWHYLVDVAGGVAVAVVSVAAARGLLWLGPRLLTTRLFQPTPRTTNRLTLLLCAALVLAFLAQGWGFVRANSQTQDEAIDLVGGYSHLARHDFRLTGEHPPLLKELAALPIYLRYHIPFEPPADLWDEADDWGIARDWLVHSGRPYDELITLGRLPILLLGATLVALVGWWSYRLWGWKAALLGTALAAFEPNLIAHAGLITTDLGATLFMFLAMYLLWEYGNSRSPWLLVGTALCTGLALASKHSGVLLFVVVGLILTAHVLLPDSPLLPGAAPGRRGRLGQAVRVATVVGWLALLTLLAAYSFRDWTTWPRGLFWHGGRSGAGWPAFFLGRYSDTGWYAYFPVAFLIKTPVASVALILGSLVFWRAGTPLRLREALFLLLPVAVVLAVIVRARVNMGLRYALPIYPFLFVCAARLATVSFARRWLAPALLGLAALLTAVSSLRTAPHQLAYFNEVVGGPAEGYRYLLDSNLDWGQDLKGLKEYVDREGLTSVYLAYFGTAPPEAAYGIHYQQAPTFDPVSWSPGPALPTGPAPRVLAVSANNLQGLYLGEPGPYHRFLSRVPRARIGDSIWVYDLEDAGAKDDLANAFRCAAGREEEQAARHERDGNPRKAARCRQDADYWRRAAGKIVDSGD
jgi:hypothetical protein